LLNPLLFYRTGDRIQLGGVKGDVIDIGVFRTMIMECGEWVGSDDHTGRIVRVPAGVVFREPVFNYSAEFPFLWDEITLPITFASDHEAVAKQISEECECEMSDATRLHLVDTYGMRALELSQICAGDPSALEPIVEGRVEIMAQVDFGVREEFAASVSDILIRRTQVFFRDEDQGLTAAHAVAEGGREAAQDQIDLGDRLGGDEAQRAAKILGF